MIVGLMLVGLAASCKQSGAGPEATGSGGRSNGTGGEGTGGAGSGGAGSGGVGSGGASSGGAPALDGGIDEGTGGNPGGGGGGGGVAEGCLALPTPVRRTGTIVEFPIESTYGGQPFVYGEPNQISSGATVTPLNMRFYLSSVELLSASGGSVAVDIVTSAGEVAPYDVFFFNADDAAAQTLRVLAPPGSYTGIRFALGLNVACNTGSSAGRSFPLSEDSQMTWPHLVGYLFLRYESQVTLAATEADGGTGLAIPPVIHMGGDLRDLGATTSLATRVDGDIVVHAGESATRRLRVAMDQIFKGATSNVDVSDVPAVQVLGPEVIAGERLRRTGRDLPLFVFAP
jgi:hypothetical protein